MGILLLACVVIGGGTGLVYRSLATENQQSVFKVLMKSVLGSLGMGLMLYWLLASTEYGLVFAILFSWVGGIVALMAFTSQKVKKTRPVYY